MARKPVEAGETQNRFSLTASEGTNHADMLILDFQLFPKLPPSLWCFVKVAWGLDQVHLNNQG